MGESEKLAKRLSNAFRKANFFTSAAVGITTMTLAAPYPIAMFSLGASVALATFIAIRLFADGLEKPINTEEVKEKPEPKAP